MAGAEKLLEKILGEAQLQIEENLKQAKEEAAGIINSAHKEADKRKTEILKKAEVDASDLRKRMLAISGLEIRKKVLRTKQDVVEEAFSKALIKLNSMSKEAYEGAIAGMIVSLAKTGDEEIILSKTDKNFSPDFLNKVNSMLISKGMLGSLRISDEARDFNGGFILKAGDIEINNTFDALLKMKHDELEFEVVKILLD